MIFSLGQTWETTAGAVRPSIAPYVAAGSGAAESVATRSIWPGVATRVMVYVATRLIDRWVFSGGRR